jgi:N-acetyl-anhydromuramyl-L-alanine amidase AmpD
MPFKLTWLPTVLKNAGLKVAEESGWPNRGQGDVGVIRGVMCHHTAGAKTGNLPSRNALVNGVRQRNGRFLPGPLAQLGLARDGTFHIIAAGLANHAGPGEWQGVTTGNSSFIGIEAENTGDPQTDPWPEVQLDAYRRGVAAILKHIGEDAIMCCGHKEYRLPKGFKNDPHTIEMDDFRRDVAAIMNGTVPIPPPIPRADADGRPTLRRSSAANPVFLVKEIQRKVGFSGKQADGVFGPLTEAAVRRFQRDHGLVPDGIVGPKTWAALDGVAA